MRGLKKSFMILFMMLITGCANQSTSETNYKISERSNENLKSVSTETKDNIIWGTWILERVVLKSESYDGTSKEALAVDLESYIVPETFIFREAKEGDKTLYYIDEDDYIGYEIEFTNDFFRLGYEKITQPMYNHTQITASAYNDGGMFRLSDLFGFLEDEGITLEKRNEDGEAILDYFELAFDENYLIPVGTQCIMLNENTMLVGTWGKIILAQRVQ